MACSGEVVSVRARLNGACKLRRQPRERGKVMEQKKLVRIPVEVRSGAARFRVGVRVQKHRGPPHERHRRDRQEEPLKQRRWRQRLPPDLLPDSKRIAFESEGIQSSNAEGDEEIYVLKALDGQEEPLQERRIRRRPRLGQASDVGVTLRGWWRARRVVKTARSISGGSQMGRRSSRGDCSRPGSPKRRREGSSCVTAQGFEEWQRQAYRSEVKTK
jgi:hypothetical protein